LSLVAQARLIASVRAMAMSVQSEQFDMRTTGKGTYEITDEVQQVVKRSGVATGTVTIFVQHTSCSLVIMENAAPAARRDLEQFFERLVPEDAHYEHDDEGPDDSTSHIRMALTRTSEVIPVTKSRIQLGTWQGIFLFEHRRAPHTRKIVITVIGE
jgi:secondary thiamine-phosphate synthase enzyme